MQLKIIKYSKQTTTTKWNDPQWLIDDKDNIALSNGHHLAQWFEGTILPNKLNPGGLHGAKLTKSEFRPIQGAITIEIEN